MPDMGITFFVIDLLKYTTIAEINRYRQSDIAMTCVGSGNHYSGYNVAHDNYCCYPQAEQPAKTDFPPLFVKRKY